MSEIHPLQRRALEYIRNTGGAPAVEWFNDDHEPIGPKLLQDLEKLGMITVASGRIALTAEGTKAIS